MKDSTRHYILEIDDGLYHYQNGQFWQSEQYEEDKGDETKWLITHFPSDMQQAISRLTTVETAPKYAEIMAGKKLQEEGEFTEPVHIINHSTQKKAANRTELFYTALTATRYQQYQDKISESNTPLLIIPLYKLLLQIIRKMQVKKPIALIFRHGRIADLLIANHKTVYYTNQATSFDTSEEQIKSLWNIIHHDLTTVEQKHKIRIGQCIICNWFDATDKPDWPDRTINITPSTSITVHGESRSCSLLPLLDLLNVQDSISPALDKLSTLSKQNTSITQIIVLLLSLGLLAGSTLYQTKTEIIKQEINRAKQEIRKQSQSSRAANVNYKETLQLLETLDTYRVSKTFKIIINDLSTSISAYMLIEQVKADVQNDAMLIEIRGTINARFQTAYRSYQTLVKNLVNSGYTIQESTFNTEIDTAEFILNYSCPIGREN